MKKLVVAAFWIMVAVPSFGSGVLPFIENDFEQAVSRAKSMRLPIFVEAWAPW